MSSSSGSIFHQSEEIVELIKPINLSCESLDTNLEKKKLEKILFDIKKNLPIELHISCIEISDSKINCAIEIYADYQTHSVKSLVQIVEETLRNKIDSDSKAKINIRTLEIGKNVNLANSNFIRKLGMIFPEIKGISFDENKKVNIYLSDTSRINDIKGRFKTNFSPSVVEKLINFTNISTENEFHFDCNELLCKVFSLDRKYLSSLESVIIKNNDCKIILADLSHTQKHINKINGKLSTVLSFVKSTKNFEVSVNKSELYLDLLRKELSNYNNILAVKYKLIDGFMHISILINSRVRVAPKHKKKSSSRILVNNIEDIYTANIFTILPANMHFKEVKDNGQMLWINSAEPISNLIKYREQISKRTGVKKILFNEEALVPVSDKDLLIRLYSRIKTGLELQRVDYNMVTRNITLTFINEPNKDEIDDIMHITGSDISIAVANSVTPPDCMHKITKPLRESKSVYTRGTKRYETLITRNYGPCPDIGNSAIIVEMGDLKILLDCGSDFKDEDNQFIDDIHFRDIDVVILSHAHTDHVGRLPYLLKKYPHIKILTTKASMLLSEYVLSQCLLRRNNLGYNVKDLEKVYKSCALIKPDTEYQLSERIRLTCVNSGHAPGSIMVKLSCDNGQELFYTGDLNRQATSLLPGANIGDISSRNVIIDCTYGISTFPKREEVISTFRNNLRKTALRGGKVLIPSLVIGRSQEVMIEILRLEKEEKFFSENKINIYIDGAIYKINKVLEYLHFQYPDLFNTENHDLIREFFNDNKLFTYIKNKRERKNLFSNKEPSVIIASSGMLFGISNEYFQRLKQDERNLLMMVNYQSQDSKGRKLLKDRKAYKNKMEIAKVQFSAHNKFEDTLRTLEELGAKVAYLIHADSQKIELLENIINRGNLPFVGRGLSIERPEIMRK